jgi:hypothetical protein
MSDRNERPPFAQPSPYSDGPARPATLPAIQREAGMRTEPRESRENGHRMRTSTLLDLTRRAIQLDRSTSAGAQNRITRRTVVLTLSPEAERRLLHQLPSPIDARWVGYTGA